MTGAEPLSGGIANAGQVVRDGDHVLRPAAHRTLAIHSLLRYVRSRGFDGVPEPIGIDSDGRERLTYIPGDVAIPPFPAWFQTDASLASVARLLRRYHDAAAGFSWPDAEWSTELADPVGGDLLCHNDMCPENVVFRDGEAVALLDFDFAAPGRPIFDLAALASMCGPMSDPESAAVWGWVPNDAPSRLRIVADAYGLEREAERRALLDRLAERIASAGAFVARHAAAGEAAFVSMLEQMGGLATYDRRRAWFAANRDRFLAALTG